MRTLDEEGNPVELENQTEECSCRKKCPLSKEIIDMLVEQMSSELANHSLYMTFANYFAVEGLVKLETYFIRRAKEEYLHHEWIYKYLTENDAIFQYPAIEQTEVEITDRTTPFELSVDREVETTQSINTIVEKAMEIKDWATFQWLNGDSKEDGMLVKEQVEEESTSRTALEIAKMDGSWLRKASAILSFYKKKQ